MISAKLQPDTLLNKEAYLFWDDIFHDFICLTKAMGIYLLWQEPLSASIPVIRELFKTGECGFLRVCKTLILFCIQLLKFSVIRI